MNIIFSPCCKELLIPLSDERYLCSECDEPYTIDDLSEAIEDEEPDYD